MSNSQGKVNSGPPIWLWLILVPLTLAIIGGVIFTSIPPDLDQAYADAVASTNDPDGKNEFEDNLALLKTDPAYANHVRYLEGRLALNQNRDPLALKLFGEIPEDSSLKPEAERRAGDAYRRMGKIEEAIAAYRRALKGDSDVALGARLNLASLYFAMGGVSLALQELDENIQLDPAHEESHMLRARIRVFLEDYEAAKEDFEVVLDSPGKYSSAVPEFVAEYFKCLVELKEVDKLKELSDPPDTSPFATIIDAAVRSSVLSEIGEYREAMVTLQTMEGPETQSSDFRKAQLKLLLSEENYEEAERLATEMVGLIPRDLGVMELATKAFAANGATRKQKIAEENLQQLLDLKRQLTEAIDVVSGDVTNAAGRAAVARLYRELGNYQQMDSWFSTAAMLDESLLGEYEEARNGKDFPVDPLVSFDEPKESEGKESEASDAGSETDPAKEEAAQDKPVSDKPAVDEATKKGGVEESTSAEAAAAEKKSEAAQNEKSADGTEEAKGTSGQQEK